MDDQSYIKDRENKNKEGEKGEEEKEREGMQLEWVPSNEFYLSDVNPITFPFTGRIRQEPPREQIGMGVTKPQSKTEFWIDSSGQSQFPLELEQQINLDFVMTQAQRDLWKEKMPTTPVFLLAHNNSTLKTLESFLRTKHSSGKTVIQQAIQRAKSFDIDLRAPTKNLMEGLIDEDVEKDFDQFFSEEPEEDKIGYVAVTGVNLATTEEEVVEALFNYGRIVYGPFFNEKKTEAIIGFANGEEAQKAIEAKETKRWKLLKTARPVNEENTQRYFLWISVKDLVRKLQSFGTSQIMTVRNLIIEAFKEDGCISAYVNLEFIRPYAYAHFKTAEVVNKIMKESIHKKIGDTICRVSFPLGRRDGGDFSLKMWHIPQLPSTNIEVRETKLRGFLKAQKLIPEDAYQRIVPDEKNGVNQPSAQLLIAGSENVRSLLTTLIPGRQQVIYFSIPETIPKQNK